ncbi:MAG: hypothetical protein HY648_13850 [Acidobacteria bacterium]|nr:hypothetical protein [Acidobacteriota bacterium]
MAIGNISTLLIAGGILLPAIGLGWHLRRRKKSAQERERERRLAVNALGRVAEGTLSESDSPLPDSSRALLFYHYEIAGVGYSAAQDITALRHLVPEERCVPGETVTVKYDPHNPSNSILICELWSGLPETGIKSPARKSPPTPQRQTTLAH